MSGAVSGIDLPVRLAVQQTEAGEAVEFLGVVGYTDPAGILGG